MKKLYLSICHVIFLLAVSFSANAQNFWVEITTLNEPSCDGIDGSLGSSLKGGTAPFSYEWKDHTGTIIGAGSTISGVSAGITSLEVTDALGLRTSDTINFAKLFGYIEHSPANCPASDGSATVSVQGDFESPLHVQWSNGSTNISATDLSGGEELSVEVTDDEGCPVLFGHYDNNGYNFSQTGSVKITSVPSFDIDHTFSPATCTDPDGSANILVTGGSAPYTYIWNTSPVKTTASVTGLVSGSYNVTVTDATGCSGNYSFYLTNTSGGLYGFLNATDEMCVQQNGAVTLTFGGGQAPHTVTWYDGVTNTNSRTNLSAGYYSVQVKDANDCVINKSVFVDRLSPILLSVSNTPADCNNENGALNLSVNNGTAPYTFKWSNNATSEDISGLSIGYYNVYVEDAVGCTAKTYKYLYTQSNCQGIITGRVFQDDNENCAYDAGELTISNSFVSAMHVSSSYSNCGFTGGTGIYNILYPFGGNYAVNNTSASPHYVSQCPGETQNVTVTSPNTSVVNFAMVPSEIGADLRTYLSSTVVRPGFKHHYTLYVANVGTQMLASGYIDVQLSADEVLTNFSVTPLLYDASTNIVRFGLSNFGVTDYRSIKFSCSIPPTVLLNTKFTVTATAYPVSGDLVEEDNAFALKQTVVGSYDPNDIQSFKEHELVLNEDTALIYHIRFQNTGTFYAEFVRVIDTLEANLDVNTLREVVTSHPVKVRVISGNVVEFAFEDIFLQDSTTNEPESHGFITYKINLKKDLTYGDEIKNSAAIYFDYNPPVLTNKARNIVTTPTGILDGKTIAQKAWAYPNPARDVVKFNFDTSVETLEILNAAGQIVSRHTVHGTSVEMATPAAKGFYYYKAMDRAGNTYSGKLVVE